MAKGLTFSIIAFLFVGISFLISILFSSLYEISLKKSLTEKDVEFLLKTKDFIKNDISNFLEISIPRILNSIISYEIENGVFVIDARDTIRDVLFNSKFYDESLLIKNSTLLDYESRIKDFLKRYGVTLSILPIDLKIFHVDSFTLLTRLILYLNLSYKEKNISSLEIIERNISIIGFEDPFYIISVNGKASNYIKTKRFDYIVKKDLDGIGRGTARGKAVILFDRNLILSIPDKRNYILVTNNESQIADIIDLFAGVIVERNFSNIKIPHVIGRISNITNNTLYLIKDGKAFNIQNLNEIVENQMCFSSQWGGSFLDRLEGRNRLSGKYNLTQDSGLECFVNKDYLLLSNVEIFQNKTNIDYIYFSRDFPKSFKIGGFKNLYVDEPHVFIYQLNEIIEN